MTEAFSSFVWHPGEGYRSDALARIRDAFPCPGEPMGEAWFMGKERRLFWNLFGNADALSTKELRNALVEIASGPCAFGQYEEWTQWFHYLLPRLIPRSHETYAFDTLLEHLVTAFMAQHPDGLAHEPCPGFRRDVLDTLGRCLMDAVCWTEEGFDVGLCLNKFYMEGVGSFLWADASGKLSASLFFCLKYLRPEAVAAWMRSVLEIPNPYWRAQTIAWLVGAHGLLSGRHAQPSDLEGGRPDVTWDWSHCLAGNYHADRSRTERSVFLPEANRANAIETIRAVMTEQVILDWIESIAAHEDLAFEMADLPLEVFDLYGQTPR